MAITMDLIYRPLRLAGFLAPEEGLPRDLAGYQHKYQRRLQSRHDNVERRAADLAAGIVYIDKIPSDLSGPARKLLEQYSGIKGAAQFEQHVKRIRNDLWEKKHTDASIGHFRFLSLDFTADPCYEIALARMLANSNGSSPTTFLDVGCGLGQVLRRLTLDGVDSSRLYGCDVEPDFIEAGYELFGDRHHTKATFVTADLIATLSTGVVPQIPTARYVNAWDSPEYRIDNKPQDNKAMDALNGKIDFIHASSLFHLFGWETQKKAAIRMVKLLKKDDPAVMIFGRHVGVSRPRNLSYTSLFSDPSSLVSAEDLPNTRSSSPGPISPGLDQDQTCVLQGRDKRYLHDARSWQKLWDEVGEATGTRWRTEVDWLGPPIQSMVDSSGYAVRRMRFAVFRS